MSTIRALLLLLFFCALARADQVYVPPGGTANLDGKVTASLPHWFATIKTSGTATVAIVGDSTSDQTGNAAAFYANAAFYQSGGENLHGVTLLDFGSNGASLAVFLSGGGTAGKTISDLIAARPDLIVFSYLINDVRTGSVTLSQATAMLATAINTLRAALPSTDIVLRMPNSLCDDAATNGTYISNTTQQAASDILRNAYRAMENRWSNVVLMDTQRDIFGETVLTLANNPWMSDALHPSGQGYSAIVDSLVTLIGYREPVSKSKAARARQLNYGLDYTYYARAVEDTDYYDLVATGKYNSAGTNFLRFGWPSGRSFEIQTGDLCVMGDQAPWVITGSIGTYNDGSTFGATQISQTPPVSIASGTVKVYRHKYAADQTVEVYAKSYAAYPYRWRGIIDNDGTSFARVRAFSRELPAGSRTATTTGDVMVVPGIGAITGFSTGVFSAEILQFDKGGQDFGPSGATVWIFGTHAYENGSTVRVISDSPPGTQSN